MRIGLTFDLRSEYLALGYGDEETAELDQPGTIDAIESTLRVLGHHPQRIGGLRPLMAALLRGDRWDLVFNICEGMHGVGREAQVPAVLDAFQIPYTFADPLSAALTLDKAMTKRVLRSAGIATADFAVVEVITDVDAVDLGWPAFCKPIAEGTAKGIDARSRVETRDALRARCAELLDRYRQPVLVEPFLPGREVTCGIVGTGRQARVIGTLEIELAAGADAHAYTYRNKEECETLCTFARAVDDDAAAAEALALSAWRALGCRDGGRVDLQADRDGRFMVLEINPLPGLHPTHSDLPILATQVGLAYSDLLAEIVGSAAERVFVTPRVVSVDPRGGIVGGDRGAPLVRDAR